jgi:hypothetical protein
MLVAMKPFARRDIEDLLRTIALVGLVALLSWLALGVVGTALGTLWPEYHATLRLALAALTLMGPHALLTEIRERRLRRIPPDERFGFAVHDPPRPSGT